jgi:hypothetical protein
LGLYWGGGGTILKKPRKPNQTKTQRTKGTNKDIKKIIIAFGGLIFLKSVMIKTSKI